VSNIFDQCKTILTIDDVFVINEALSKVEPKITGHNYESHELDFTRADASSSEQDSNEARGGNNRISEKPEQASDTAAIDDTLNSEFDKADVINALQQIKIESDFMDISRAGMDVSENSIYHISAVFDYDGVDIDSFDCVSIKMSNSDLDIIKRNVDWPSIFADIERNAQDPFAQDIFDIDVPDIEYKPIRASISLVKGKEHSRSIARYGSSEHKHAETRNIASIDNGQTIEPGQSLNIPVKLYMENSELVLKANLSGVNLDDLQRMNNLSNIKSMLSLIPRKTQDQ